VLTIIVLLVVLLLVLLVVLVVVTALIVATCFAVATFRRLIRLIDKMIGSTEDSAFNKPEHVVALVVAVVHGLRGKSDVFTRAVGDLYGQESAGETPPAAVPAATTGDNVVQITAAPVDGPPEGPTGGGNAATGTGAA
jgi:hypothetical protein